MRRAERKHEWLICCGEVSLTAPQKRNHPKGDFFFCVHFTPQSRLRLDGRSVSGLLLFTSTPQSIAKPSPGWNKVALLTAVRNSPCSCPFSVSLIRPLGALNSEPRSGSLLVLPPTKSCPRLWGKWHEVPKGVRLKTAECRELFPLSFAYAQQNAG